MKNASYLSSKCIVKKSPINGIGVFAKEKILKNELITAWGGIVCTGEEIKLLSKENKLFMNYPITIYKNLYLMPFKFSQLEKSERFNHSCQPNAGIKGQIILIARRNINVGEEICFDYETTESGKNDGLPFECKCQSKKCRGKITGGKWLNKKFRKDNKGYFSWYLEEKIEKSRKKI